jgi:hypothetical protein
MGNKNQQFLFLPKAGRSKHVLFQAFQPGPMAWIMLFILVAKVEQEDPMGLEFLDRLFKEKASLENLTLEASLFTGSLGENPDEYLLEIRFSHTNDSPVIVHKLTIGTEEGFLLDKLERTFGEEGKSGTGIRLEKSNDAYILNIPVPDHYLGWLKASPTFILVTTDGGNFYWSQVNRKVLKVPSTRKRALPLGSNPALSHSH